MLETLPLACRRRPLAALSSLVNLFPRFSKHDLDDDTDHDSNNTTLDDTQMSPQRPQKSLLALLDDATPQRPFSLELHIPHPTAPSAASPPSLPLQILLVGQDLLPRIDCAELARVLAGAYADFFHHVLVIDCRFSYEYDGGHIAGAVNLALQRDLETHFSPAAAAGARLLLVFHCEYLVFRGPTMAAHLRKLDRAWNAERYPHLSYPDIVVLDGGYSLFFAGHPALCHPCAYVEMKDIKHKKTCEAELSRARQASKLLRARLFHQFSPRIPAHGRLASFTALLLTSDLPLHLQLLGRNRLKVGKRDTAKRGVPAASSASCGSFGAAVFSGSAASTAQLRPPAAPAPAAPACASLHLPYLLPLSLTFDDDFAPPPPLFRNHSKSLSTSLLSGQSLHSVLLLGLDDSLLSVCSLSDLLVEPTDQQSLPFMESARFFDEPCGTKFNFPSGSSGGGFAANGENRNPRLLRIKTSHSNHLAPAMQPAFGSHCMETPFLRPPDFSSDVDLINELPVDLSLNFRTNMALLGRLDDVDVDERDEE